MQPKLFMLVFAPLALCASTVLAQDALPPSPRPVQIIQIDKAEMQQHFVEMCSDRYAHVVGDMAYLEAKLALTDKQRPLFARWKAIKLANAKAHASDCAGLKPTGRAPSIIDGMKMEAKMLKARLADLDAEMPALETLVAALSDEQKNAFEPGDMGGPVMLMRHGPGNEMFLFRRGPGLGGLMPPPPDEDGPPPAPPNP